MDVHSKAKRSEIMSKIKDKNTQLELNFRRRLSSGGVRGYRVNCKILGKPDIVFTKWKIAVFVDGCFWHKCPECFTFPKTNKKFWKDKINKNFERDQIVNVFLRKSGYKVVRFWQHDLEKNLEKCVKRIHKALNTRSQQ